MIHTETVHRAPEDSRIFGLPASPYNVLAGVSSDDSPGKFLRVMLRLQRNGLSSAEDQAFRGLRNVAIRLAWDLFTLGTTPSVTAGEWVAIRQRLLGRASDTEPAELGAEDQPSALHLRGLVVLDEVAASTRENGYTADGVLERYVAWWAALLFRTQWLRSFARSRCQVWECPPPDAGDEAQFLQRAEQNVLAVLAAAAGPEPMRLARWTGAMKQERAVISAIDRACGTRGNAPAWYAGYGPLGVRLLGQEGVMRTWLSEHSRWDGEMLPLGALKAKQVGFFYLSPSRINTAGRAAQLLYSEFSNAAALVWEGQAPQALASLEEATLDGRLANEWFGFGSGGRRSREEAVQVLRIEALLLQFQDQLATPEIPAETVCETAARILTLAAMLPKPRVGVRQVESRICGRLTWCADSERLPDPREVERILSVGREIQALLTGRGEGQQCALETARVLNHRAVKTWNRGQSRRGAAQMRAQESVLRDLFEAVQLAPHNEELVTNLAEIALQFRPPSLGERISLLARIVPTVTKYVALGKVSARLEDAYTRLLEIVDPAEARQLTLQRLQLALKGGPKPT